MKKYILIKLFKGEATDAEVDSILKWVEKSPENKKFFSEQKKIFTLSQFENELNSNNNTDADCNADVKQIFEIVESRKKRRISYIGVKYYIAAAAIALIFFLTGLFLRPSIVRDTESDYFVAHNISKSITINKLYTEKGVKGFVVLPDSTKVWLNSDSEISFPESFAGKYRNVTINGEAYFEVAKDTLHPMIVTASKGFSVEVMGTSFNIKSYENDETAQTTLYTGKIKMHYKGKNEAEEATAILNPNESFIYSPTSKSIDSNAIVNTPYTCPKQEEPKAWKDGILLFHNTPMADVVKTLERWHGTKFIIKDTSVYTYALTAEFSSESIIQILEIMKMIIPIDYTYKDNTVTLR